MTIFWDLVFWVGVALGLGSGVVIGGSVGLWVYGAMHREYVLRMENRMSAMRRWDQQQEPERSSVWRRN